MYKCPTLERNIHSCLRVDIQSRKGSLFVLIKTDDKAKYKNVIDALDECNICNVGKYALVDIMKQELDLLQAKTP